MLPIKSRWIQLFYLCILVSIHASCFFFNLSFICSKVGRIMLDILGGLVTCLSYPNLFHFLLKSGGFGQWNESELFKEGFCLRNPYSYSNNLCMCGHFSKRRLDCKWHIPLKNVQIPYGTFTYYILFFTIPNI